MDQEMDLCETKKFVCKHCNKIYPCGKSLGGHLRSHNLVDDQEKAKQTENCYDYDVREKLIGKTWRFSGSSSAYKQQLRICKECGKEFQSVKALCGHMACHSEKEKQKDIMYVDSDTESSGPMQQRRSKRLRCKTPDVHSSPVLMANAGSSLRSKTEQELEEVALCLLMLSRDIGSWDGVNSLSESSDNNSTKSAADMDITTGNGLFCASDRKFVAAKIDVSDDSDSDYFETGMNKIKMKVSRDIFLGDDHIYGSEFQDISARSRKGSGESGTIKSYDCIASNQNGTRMGDTDDFGRIRVTEKFYPKIKIGNSCGAKFNRDSYHESIKTSTKNIARSKHCAAKTPGSKLAKSCIPASGGKLPNNGAKKSRKSKGHKCPFCPKTFRSGQALGGHKRIHFLSGDRSFVIKQDSGDSLFDLNFPPPDSEQGNGDSSYVPW